VNRSAKFALLIAGAVVSCVIAACGVALALRDWVPGLTGCEETGKPTKTAVITEKIRIEQLYPQLKPIQSVHWQEREARARSCPEFGPMDYVMNGLAVITPAGATTLLTAAPATGGPSAAAPTAPPAQPDIPTDLLPFAPPSPAWLQVADNLLLDKPSSTVYFTHTTS
jgi:hypothetical protein